MDKNGNITLYESEDLIPKGSVRLTDNEAKYLKTIPTTERRAELARLRKRRVQQQLNGRRQRRMKKQQGD